MGRSKDRKKMEAEVKQHLDAIMDLDDGWEHMLGILHQRGLQKMLREARILKGLRQSELAQLMDTTQSRISELESERYPDYKITTLAGWARALDMQFQIGATPIVEEAEEDAR